MNKTFTNIVMFAAGAAIGSFATWRLLKTTYEKRIHDEIEELDNYYSAKEPKREKEAVEEQTTEEDVSELEEIVVKEGYVRYSDIKNKKGGDFVKKPYIIPSKEFDKLDDYDAETLVYHANGVLVDDMNQRIEDVESMVGNEFQNHFGDDENDRDSVFVRNEERMIDYEILYDASEYEDDSSAYMVDSE